MSLVPPLRPPNTQQPEEILVDQSTMAALEQAVYQSLATLDAHERREYEEAQASLASFEELMHREAPVEDFLWTENFHPERAALRLVRYWKARKHVFGGDRWLLPLVQTGTGALGPEELELLRSQYFVVLRRPGNKGIVTLVDNGRLQRTPEAKTKIRLCFYLVALYAKEIRNGYISIAIERGVSRPPPLVSTDPFAIYNVAMPIKFWRRKAFLVQACYEPGKESLLDFMTFQLERTLQFNSGKRPTKIAGNSVRQTRLLLQEATGGVESECLPYCLGGTYDYRMFEEWTRQCLSIETTQMGIPVAMPIMASEHVETSTKGDCDNEQGSQLIFMPSPTAAFLPLVLWSPSTSPVSHPNPPRNEPYY